LKPGIASVHEFDPTPYLPLHLIYNPYIHNMILPGRLAFQRKIITNIRSVAHQVQPCGIDLTLKRVLTWTSPGTIDFDNTHRKTADTIELPFSPGTNPTTTPSSTNPASEKTTQDTAAAENQHIHLPHGSYLIEFNETVSMPLDLMGSIYVRSSLFRSGALLHAGVMDAGYTGPIGALLQVVNPSGLGLVRGAKCAQMVVQEMSEPVAEGYTGVYQGRGFV
jgi:dUTP pyrophosphatase